MKKEDLQFIQDQIGYRFNNLDLLQQAFTRRSYSKEHGGEDNEVLEFIGDKVLDLFVIQYLIVQNSNSGELYKRFDPKFKNSLFYLEYTSGKRTFSNENTFICSKTEAELTEIKKVLVQKKTLANKISDLGIADYLIMGSGDMQQNANEQDSVKEDLFEAILGAIAIDSNWNMDKMSDAVRVMLRPESILEEEDLEDYVSLVQAWSNIKGDGRPLYHFENQGYSLWMGFDGISQRPRSVEDQSLYGTKKTCYLKIAEDLPVFRGFGHTVSEAKINVCQVAYEYLCEKDLWLSISDELDNPNKDDAINQLEILARRGYFSIPTYKFDETYDKNGNPVWESTCFITEENKSFSAKSSSKKEAKKAAAYKMLQHVLND